MISHSAWFSCKCGTVSVPLHISHLARLLQTAEVCKSFVEKKSVAVGDCYSYERAIIRDYYTVVV